jgi:tRNA (guanosine-2'-O-)-methyltransferase
MRNETRRQRYNRKKQEAINIPVSFTTINFDFDDNLAFLIRTVACYGFSHINVIGSVPDRSVLNPKSGSLFDFVEIRQYSNPNKFLEDVRADGIKLIAADISDRAESLYEYSFDFDTETSIILGNETTGIPVEITMNSEEVFIPMPGAGFCLNTSQSGTAFATEYSRQFFDAIA